MPRYKFNERCYVPGIGIVNRNDTVMLSAEQAKLANIKPHIELIEEAEEKKEEPKKDPNQDGKKKISEMKIDELKAWLDTNGVKYTDKMNFNELQKIALEAEKLINKA